MSQTIARLRECHELECGRGLHPGSVHASLDLLRPEEVKTLLQRSQEKDVLLARLLKRLKIMCREWREAIGTPRENRTPGDCLERSEALIAEVEALVPASESTVADSSTPEAKS